MTKKVCVIVGVGPGIGLSVARRFGQEGFTVALVGRRREVLERYVADLISHGVKAHAYPADAERGESLVDAFGHIARELGAPSVLVYNAAAPRGANPSGLGVEALVRDFRVNVGGALVSAQQVLPAMRAAKSGTILFTGGGLALEPWPELSSLAIGKSGIRSLAISLAKEVEPEGIHVATVTVDGVVKAGTPLDPDYVADEYWRLHKQGPGSFEREVVLRTERPG